MPSSEHIRCRTKRTCTKKRTIGLNKGTPLTTLHHSLDNYLASILTGDKFLHRSSQG
jgi:hypothetical protein